MLLTLKDSQPSDENPYTTPVLSVDTCRVGPSPPPFYRWGVSPVPLNTKPCTFARFDSGSSCLRNVTFPSQRWQPQQTGTTLEFTCHTQPVLSGMQDSRREARGETSPCFLQLWTVRNNSGRVRPVNMWGHISFHRLPGFLRVSLEGASSIFHLGSDLDIFLMGSGLGAFV